MNGTRSRDNGKTFIHFIGTHPSKEVSNISNSNSNYSYYLHTYSLDKARAR